MTASHYRVVPRAAILYEVIALLHMMTITRSDGWICCAMLLVVDM